MRRLLAAVAAVGMIAGAMAIRSARDDGGGATADSVGVICAAELETACETLAAGGGDFMSEPAAATADRLANDPSADAVVWLAPAPWPAMVDDTRERAGLQALFDSAPIVARTPLVVVGDQRAAGCSWRCVGDGAAAGTLRVGWPPPASTTVGLLAIGAATSAWFGTPDVAANDFDVTFLAWLAAVADGGQSDADPVARILQSRAFFDVAVGTEAGARRLLSAADPSRRAGLHVLYPEPMTTLDVALATRGDAPGGMAGRARDALVAAGYRPPGEPGDPPLPETSGLPRPGVLVALRDQVAR